MEVSFENRKRKGIFSTPEVTAGWGKRFLVVLFLMLIWILLQSLATFKGLDAGTSRQVMLLKNQAGIAAIIVGTLLYVRRLRIELVAIAGLLFAVYAFLIVSAKVGFSVSKLSLPVMYALWVWGVFVLFPVVLDSRRKVEVFLRFAVWGTVLVILYTSIWSIINRDFLWSGAAVSSLSNIIFERADRFVFGWQNPLYAGSLFAATAVGTLYIYAYSSSSSEKSLAIVSFLLLFVGLLVTVARSALVFLLVTLLVVGLRNRRLRSFLALFVWASVLMGVGWLLYLSFHSSVFLSLDQLNDLSTGRLEVWTALLNSTDSYLFGNATFIEFSGVYQDVSSTVLQIFRVDSVYLEMALLYGVPGAVVFSVLLLLVLRFLKPEEKATLGHSNWLVGNLGFAIFMGMLAAGLTNSIFPSLGNLYNAILLPVAVASAVQLRAGNEKSN